MFPLHQGDLARRVRVVARQSQAAPCLHRLRFLDRRAAAGAHADPLHPLRSQAYPGVEQDAAAEVGAQGVGGAG